ncbi:nucleotidyltransferase family protein [Desulfotomaculum defluvii]
MIDALVLAGSMNNVHLKNNSSEAYEALIRLGPLPMLWYVICALRNCNEVQRIVVVGPPEVKKELPPDVLWVESGLTMIENIQRGNALMKSHYLVASSDIPLLTSESISGFLELCKELTDDLYYPLIPRETVEKAFPGAQRTYVSFREGVFTGGNLFLVNPRVVERCLTIGQELVDLRKKVFALAWRVGIPLLLKLLFRVLTLQEAQERVSKMLNIRGRAIICPYPEVGMDIDKPADLELICRALGYERCKVAKYELYGVE